MSVNGDDVVVDKASGLMWHQAGSEVTLDFFSAQEWVDDLNIQKYAGYSDWRLPTLEEAISLYEMKTNKDMNIDPVFSYSQRFIWTGDGYYPGRIWLVIYYKRAFPWYDLKTNIGWVLRFAH
jgi:hypothetical protein